MHELDSELENELIYFFCVLSEVVAVFGLFFFLFCWLQEWYCWLQGWGWVLAAAAVEEGRFLKEKEEPTEWAIYKTWVTAAGSHWRI